MKNRVFLIGKWECWTVDFAKIVDWNFGVSQRPLPPRLPKFQNLSCSIYIWLVVSTHLKNISQTGNLPQIGVKIKNIWNILKPPTRYVCRCRSGRTSTSCSICELFQGFSNIIVGRNNYTGWLQVSHLDAPEFFILHFVLCCSFAFYFGAL